MPIKWMQDKPPRFHHKGRIRLGHKETSKRTGKEYPKADPFFVLGDVPELVELLGEKPVTIPISFLFDDLELTFPHYMRRYGRMGLLCLGDGEHVIHQKVVEGRGENVKTRLTVRDMGALDDDGKTIWEDSPKRVRRVPCPGETCPHYQDGECKPTGYLKFLVQGAESQGYYDLVCHQRAVLGILAQLQMAQGFFGRLTDIPWLLHRGDEEQVEVPTPGGPRPMKIRTQWIEIESKWFREHVGRRKEMLLEEKRMQRLLVADTLDLFDDDLPPRYTPPAPAAPAPDTLAEFETPDYDGEMFDHEPEDGDFEEVPAETDPDEPDPADFDHETETYYIGDLLTAALKMGYHTRTQAEEAIREELGDENLVLADEDGILTMPWDVFYKAMQKHAPGGEA